MKINVFRCKTCSKEHREKVYDNVSEGTADLFTERFFTPIWEKFKDEPREPLEKFCKDFMFFTIYTYHLKRRRIHVAKNSVEHSDGIENPEH